MSNPYASPQVPPSPKIDPESFADDPAIKRLRPRQRVCSVAIGIAAFLLAATMLIGTFSAETLGGRLAAGSFFISAFLVGWSGVRGLAWPLYAGAAASTLYLGYLGAMLVSTLPAEELLGPETLLLIFLVVSTPGIVVLPISIYGIAVDRAIRRLRAELIRDASRANGADRDAAGGTASFRRTNDSRSPADGP